MEGEARMRRNAIVITALAAVAGLAFGGVRTLAGVLLGSVLSEFNLRWMKSSTAAILAPAAANRDGRVPKWTASKFILRWFVLVITAAIAVWSGWFDPMGIGIGLASFVFGVMVEAGYQAFRTFKE